MKNLLFSFFLVSSLAHAAPATVSIKDFNFTYKNPYGEGSASSFTRGGFLMKGGQDGISVKLDKIEKDFKISLSGAEYGEFVFKNAPSFMIDAETMAISQFNLSLDTKISLSLGQATFNSKNDSLKLDGLNLNCNRDTAGTEIDQLVSGCIQSMSLKSSKFSSSFDESNIVSVLSHSIASATQNDKGITGAVGVSNVDLGMSGGKFNLTAEVKAQISGKVKASGGMSYDASVGVLTIKISEVKFGILSVKSKVFDELKKNESDKMKVKEPYIYYTVK